MIDLTTIDQETIIARGQYATVRAEHENEKKKLVINCGQLSSIAAQITRLMQPDGDTPPDMAAVNDLLSFGRNLLNKIEASKDEIQALALQRAALKDSAWGAKR